LADALREAVRIGAGVNIASQTKASELTLQYDRIFESAFGYVRDYKVTSAGMGKDGFYHVTVSALVDRGNPDLNDTVAIKQLVALHHSPRITFDITDDISFIPKNSGFANEWFIETAKKFQLNVVIPQADGSMTKDHNLNSGTNSLNILIQNADYIIKGIVKGKYTITDGVTQNSFSLSAELKAIIPETGEVIATQLIRPSEPIATECLSPPMAARIAVFKMLDGADGAKDFGADALFRKIMIRWASELDLGRVVRIEFVKMNSDQLKDVEDKLKNNVHISGVWHREFNENGSSFIDLETRLNTTQLTKDICDSSDGYFGLSHGTENYLKFVKWGSGSKKIFLRWLESLWDKAL